MGGPVVDFAALFRAIPTPYLVMAPDLVIVDANPAYLANVGRSLADIAGRHVFDAFPPAPDALDPASGLSRVQLSFEKALATGRPDTMPIQKYDIPDPAGGMSVRYWSLISVPVPGPDGRPALLVQRAEDITDFVAEREQGRAAAEEGQGWRRRVAEVEADLFARAQELQVALAAEEAASRRVTSLAEVAFELTTADTLEDLERIVIGRGVRVMGADGGGIAVLSDDGTCRVTLDDALGEQTLASYAAVPATSPLPAVHSARTGERVLLGDTAAGLAFTPEMAGVYEANGRQAWAFFPLRVRDEVLGSLAVSWTEPQEFGEADLELLEGFAAQCAQALARLRARQAERAATLEAQRMSEVLQRSLLTSPPSPDSLRISVRYQPAAEEAQVGGDWYDAFVTALGSALLVVGDVNGHDQTAAATMGQIRNLLRGLAYDSDDSPAVLLNRLDGALAGLELDTLATAVLCRVEQSPSDRLRGVRRLRFSNAGHLPPLLRQPDGSVQVLLTGESDLLLGFDPSAARSERVVELVEGCTLLLFTDGLVERRDAGLDDGIDRLVVALSEHGGGDPEQLCDALLRVVAPGGNDDDIALLVLRVDEGQDRRSA